MLAHHPITGAPIRILKTETHLYKNQKTVAWLRTAPDQYAEPKRMSRWETILIDSVPLIEQWCDTLGTLPSAFVFRQPTDDALKWLRTSCPREGQLVFLSKHVMDVFGMDEIQREGFKNIICLEEMAEMFPHILRPYKETDSDAIVALAIAVIYRASRLVGLESADILEESFGTYFKQVEAAYDLSVHEHMEPQPLWFITQFYTPEKAKRARELKYCLEQNIRNPLIDRILLLNEHDITASLPKSSKIEQVVLGHRLAYADVLRYIYESVPKDTLVTFANSDIVLDNSWRQLWSLNMNDVFLSLLRYEMPTDPDAEPELFGPRPDSQDTWVVAANSVQSRTWDWSTFDFQFGKSGCDNAINVEMLRKKFVVANPALSFRTLHCHASQYRTYDPKDVVQKLMFLYLDPTGLHDLEPRQDIRDKEADWTVPSVFDRTIRSIESKYTKTVCSMVGREQGIALSENSPNTFKPSKEESLYKFKNAFTTTNGLVYGYKSIYVSRQPHIRDLWAPTTISHITPCIGVKSFIAAYLPDEVVGNPLKFLTRYLARVLRVRDAGHEGDFWLPRGSKRLQEFVQRFQWKESVLPVVPRDDMIAAYSDTTTWLTPRLEDVVYREDVEALRSHLRNWSDTILHPKRVVVVQDDNVLDSNDVEALEKVLEAAGYEVDVVYSARSSAGFLLQRLVGASAAVVPKGAEDLYWMLPRGARVVEVMPELDIKGDGLHMAGAASLDYWVLLTPRAKKEQLRETLVKQIADTLAADAPKPIPVETSKPLLVLPKNQGGLHEHSGDSFREMVELWAEQGKCRLEYSTTTPYVWWNGVGETLLYDRANYSWLKNTPAPYKKLLCGNPAPEDQPNASVWSFWPRRPRLLELRVARGLPSWDERKKTMVFYGRVENHVQMAHRNNELGKACDEFDCPARTIDRYKYSQNEYLNQLANSKFGLCLAGYGLKCNREMECMALGTVPVCAPDVDMKNYYNPPVENVHYIRLQSFDPEEAAARLREMSREDWERMSAAAHQWWKENASAEGLWTLTKALAQV